MNKNDLIAEYIKEKYPEILETFDFQAWELRVACQELGKKIREAMGADYSRIKAALAKVNKEMKEKKGE